MATTPTPISAADISFPTRLRHLSPPTSPPFIVKCSNPLNINCITDTKLSNNGGGLKNVPSGIDELAMANKEIKKQEIEARKMMDHINPLETRASEIAEAHKQPSETEHGVMVMTETERKTINNYKEKLESVKAASISAIVGTLASLPISLIHVNDGYELKVSTAIVIITCALYGATYRYTIRRDPDDFHLKTGTSAAFGIVKGVATLDGRPSLEQEAGSLLSHAFSGAVCVFENILIFLLAAAGLDICYKMGILSPFPLDRSVSRTRM